MTAGVIAPFAGTDTDDFELWARELRQIRVDRIASKPRVRLFDGDWFERGEATEWLAGNAARAFNDGAPIHLELPISNEDRRGTYLAHWALAEAQAKRNIHIIVEKDGLRIGGFLHPENGVTLVDDADGGRVVLELSLIHI